MDVIIELNLIFSLLHKMEKLNNGAFSS